MDQLNLASRLVSNSMKGKASGQYKTGMAMGQFRSGYADDSNVNYVLKMQLDPMNSEAVILPTSDMSPTTTKTIKYVNTINYTPVLLSSPNDRIMFVYHPYSPLVSKVATLFIEIDDPGLGRVMAFHQVIDPVQNISEDFSRGILVAGGASVYSATQPGGIFNLPGIINAANPIVTGKQNTSREIF